MSDFSVDPPRWKEHVDQVNLAERAAGEALRSMRAPGPLSGLELARIAARIRNIRNIRTERPHRARLWIALTATFVLGIATAASAAYLKVLPNWLTSIANPKPVVMVPLQPPSRGAGKNMPARVADPVPTSKEADPDLDAKPSVADQPVVESSVSIPMPDNRAVERTATPPASHRRVRPPVEAAPAPQPSDRHLPARSSDVEPDRANLPASASTMSTPTASVPTRSARGTQVALQEVVIDRPALAAPTKAIPDMGKVPNPSSTASSAQGAAKHLTDAIRVLRVDRSPESALLLLNRHSAELANSVFSHEALLVRVEALLALNRQGEVLLLLDGAALVDVAASHALLVTRGKLRAVANRCAEGVGDFDLVLAESRHADRQALFGRALCRNKLGDSAGARADLERYRHEFPTDPRLHELEKKLNAP